ncbi:MAG: potassium channel family protein [Spirochaetaceae bacterium]
MNVYILRIANLAFAVESQLIRRVDRVARGDEMSRPLLERLGAVYGADFFGLPADRTGSWVISFDKSVSDVRLIVEEAEKAEDTEVSQTGREDRGGVFLGRVESAYGSVPLIDVGVFFSGEKSPSERRDILFSSIFDIRGESSVKAAQTSRRKMSTDIQRAHRRRRSKRRKTYLLHLTETVSFRVGVFLVILVAFSMAGILMFEEGVNKAFSSMWDTFWYSIVTITTVGYGDKSPITIGGKAVGLLLMGMGVIVLAAVTGQISSFLVEQQLKRREGLLKVKNLQNHFIICGWRKELEKIIDGTLSVNPVLDVSDIVLINTVGSETMRQIVDNPKYKGINYIHGDFIEETTLKKAKIHEAARVMILADASQNYSVQEVDARTVMAVLTIESLYKRLYVVAELLDEKFEKYLKLANCDEIILSREYSKMIIANASSASGVSNILLNLLSTEHGEGLETRDIPGWLIGQPFGKVCDYFNSTYGSIVIGLLENTGNFYQRKSEALNEAQMTPDISKLVENLKGVKQLVPNRSIMNPGKEYIVRKNSKAIVIEITRDKEREEFAKLSPVE